MSPKILTERTSPEAAVTEPDEFCYVIMQERNGGWQAQAVPLPWEDQPKVFVYIGADNHYLETVEEMIPKIALKTGTPTRLVRYSSPATVTAHG